MMPKGLIDGMILCFLSFSVLFSLTHLFPLFASFPVFPSFCSLPSPPPPPFCRGALRRSMLVNERPRLFVYIAACESTTKYTLRR